MGLHRKSLHHTVCNGAFRFEKRVVILPEPGSPVIWTRRMLNIPNDWRENNYRDEVWLNRAPDGYQRMEVEEQTLLFIQGESLSARHQQLAELRQYTNRSLSGDGNDVQIICRPSQRSYPIVPNRNSSNERNFYLHSARCHSHCL